MLGNTREQVAVLNIVQIKEALADMVREVESSRETIAQALSVLHYEAELRKLLPMSATAVSSLTSLCTRLRAILGDIAVEEGLVATVRVKGEAVVATQEGGIDNE